MKSSKRTGKKILVTGAAGFIGSHLVDSLVKTGENVRCFVRTRDNLEFLPKSSVEIFCGDITNQADCYKAIKGVDYVYHLAAKTDFDGKWDEYNLINVKGTRNIAKVAIHEHVKRFIFFSTIRVIGLKNSLKPVDESAAYYALNYYDESKIKAEKIVLNAYFKYKLPIVIIRPTSVYGPRDKGTYCSFFKAIAKGRFILVGKGRNLVSFVYVKNVVDAALLAMTEKKAIGQIYFINDNTPYTMEKLSITIASALGKKISNHHFPVGFGYFLGFVIENISRILKIKPILSVERVKNLTINYVFDISKAKKELRYKPKISLKGGVKETALWYKKHRWI